MTLNMKPVFLFGNLKWSYENEIFSFISAGYTIKFTEHKWNSLLMNSDTLICLWILVFPIGIIEVSTSRNCCFWIYFSSLHDYWPPSTWNSVVHNSWCEMERCEKLAFQLQNMRKKKISWNIKSKCITELLLKIRSSSMKDYTCHYVLSTWKTNVYINFNKIMRNRKFFVYK